MAFYKWCVPCMKQWWRQLPGEIDFSVQHRACQFRWCSCPHGSA